MLPWRSKRERDLSEELASHLRMAARDQGECNARRELGNVGLIKEATRASWGGLWRERVLQDLRYACRMVSKNPGFTAVAVLTMALGIGASTAVFSLVDAALFSPDPYKEARRLVLLKQIANGYRVNTSASEFFDLRSRSRTLAQSAAYADDEYDLTGAQEPQRIEGVRVSSNLFAMLGVEPALGHEFSPVQDYEGGAKEAVLSDAFFRSRFRGKPEAALGRTIRLNETPYTVIGVMPSGFSFPASKNSVEPVPALWVPMAFSKAEVSAPKADNFEISVVARLKPHISLADANNDIARLWRDFRREAPEQYKGSWFNGVLLEPLGAEVAARRKPALTLFTCGVAFVLLIACVNLSNLLLARAGAREREIAARRALGATAGRLAMQFVLETIVLTLAGGALGYVFAWVGTKGALKLAPSEALLPAAIGVDMRALFFTLFLSLATGIFCGLTPALASTRTNPGDALKQNSRGATASRSANRIRGALVILEAALSLILLIGAALLIRSFAAALATPPGFDAAGVTIVRTSFNRHRYPDAARRHNAEREIVTRLRTIPGIRQVALTTHVPIADLRMIGYVVEGRDPNDFHWADNALVDGSYFAAMRIPLKSGRTFDGRDNSKTPMVAVVNETMAREYWPNENAVGKHIRWGGRPLTIIGIAGDVHLEALELRPKPTIYCSIYQIESGATKSAVFILRAATTAPANLASQVRKIIWSVDPGLPVFQTASMESVVVRSLAARRFTMLLLTGFAALALVLAAVGLYGVLAYAVAQRTRELGVRLALGADPKGLLWQTASSGMRLALVGVLSGLAGGALLAHGMSRLLFGIAPLDLPSFAGAAGALLLVAALAGLIPGMRAARVDPMAALRCE
ncbi:MAG TPA: ABC transporter permease [Bryobacteraceae bacterium]